MGKEETSRLKPHMIERLKRLGLDPDSVTEVQLRAVEPLDDPHRFDFLVQCPTVVVALFSLGSLLSGHWLESIGWAALAAILAFVGYRVQLWLGKQEYSEETLKVPQEPSECLWQEFDGQANTEPVLIKKAEMLAPLLVWRVVSCAEHTLELLLKNKSFEGKLKQMELPSGQIIAEGIYFNLHLIDRLACEKLTADGRDTFITHLVLAIEHGLARQFASGVEAELFRQSFLDQFDERQREYGDYRMTIAENQGMEGVLPWEFSKRIAKLLELQDNHYVVLFVGLASLKSLEVMRIDELL